MILTNPRVLITVLGALCVGGIAGGVTSCSDATGPGRCEVIYVVSQSDQAPETGLRIINALSTGLDAVVSGERIVSAGADMSPGACEIWGLFAGTYQVSLQQCRQEDAGSSQCTSHFGPEVVRTVAVVQGEITELRVTSSFFR